MPGIIHPHLEHTKPDAIMQIAMLCCSRKEKKEGFVDRPSFTLKLPDWLEAFAMQLDTAFPKIEERMEWVVGLSMRNIKEGTGGPFAAAIFNSSSGSLLAAGVNMVIPARSSVLHAEIVAILSAQQKLDTHDLSTEGLPSYELVTSTEPCAMCLGAVTWSGVRRLICGARGEDAEEAGFDEGEKPPAWPDALKRRGISVLRDVCRDQAATVLRDYATSGGIIYNPRRTR
jgi:tRNA(Arg) A34 adenosine deaminase TadA